MDNAGGQRSVRRSGVAFIERRTIEVPGLTVDLVDRDEVLDIVRTRAQSDHLPPLAVASLNLDHIHHFGPGGRWAGTLDRARGSLVSLPGAVDWLNLIDGAPIAQQARRLTGHAWPRLAGSDLANPILDLAEHIGLTVGFLGGASETHALLTERLASTRPDLQVVGCWAPTREELSDPERSGAIADDIAAHGVDILVVGIGKPRQELWIAEYGPRSRARVLLAFGAVVDFLAGRVRRAPRWAAKAGLEWAWRLLLEPRRLARRYFGQGPAAYLQVRSWSAGPTRPAHPHPLAPLILHNPDDAAHGFVPLNREADVSAVIVTYNSEDDIGALLGDLRVEAKTLRMHVVVVDNGSTDGTLAALRKEPGVIIRAGHGNVGFAGGINVGVHALVKPEPVLVLNPDLRMPTGTLHAMLRRMATTGAGIVVPRIVDDHGHVATSLRREPTLLRCLGDAVFGAHFSGRSGALSETDWDVESYRFAHPVDWATGAAMLIHPDVVNHVGDWDERFFLYSEETDYFRRARDAGVSVWYEPNAVVEHRQGGSGASARLDALMAVNRVRYAQKFMSRPRAALFGGLVVAHEAARSYMPAHRLALRSVLSTRVRSSLPGAVPSPARTGSNAGSADETAGVPDRDRAPSSRGGSIIIPAHNEAAVIGRTLTSLAPAISAGRIEVIVACNGCTDGTAQLARQHHGVQVIDIAEPSKAVALNAGDRAATRWPRLYLDADIEITPDAIHEVFAALHDGTALAVRPAFRYDVAGATPAVRAYYRARGRISSSETVLWGAGAYAVGRTGHARFAEFPSLIADDLWIDRQFEQSEKQVLSTTPVRVRTPKTAQDLLATLRRTHRGNTEVGSDKPASTLGRVVGGVRGLRSALDAMIYIWFAVRARATAPAAAGAWERDASTREGSDEH